MNFLFSKVSPVVPSGFYSSIKTNEYYSFPNIMLSMTAPSVDYYWVGGTGNWSEATTHWATTSGGNTFHTVAPTAIDNVYFDANSFSSSGQTVTVNIGGDLSKNMDWTGVTNTPTFNINSQKIFIAGSLTLIPEMTLTGNNINNGTVFTSTTTGNTITSGGHDLGRIWFDGNGGEWSLTQDTQVYEVLITKGIFNTANFDMNITAGARGIQLNNETAEAIEGIKIGTSTLTMANGQNVAWDMENADVCEADQSTIIITGYREGCCGDYFKGGGFAYNILRFTETSVGSGGFWQISGDNSFNELSFGANAKILGSNTIGTLNIEPGFRYELEAGQTQTITTINGNGSCISSIELKSTSSSSPATLSVAAGTLNFDYLNLSNISATGGAIFNTINTIDGGGNSGWNISVLQATNKDLYWIGDSGNWNDGNHWSEASGGTPYGCIPTATDNVYFDANSFSSSGQTVTVNIEGDLSKNMDWTGVTNTPTFNINSQKIFIAGSLTLIPEMTLTGNNINNGTVFTSTTTGNTITSGGHDLGRIWFDGNGGEWSLTQDTQVYEVLITKGIFNTANFDMNITAGARGIQLNNETAEAIEGIKIGTSTLTMANGQNVAWDMENADVCEADQSTIIITGYREGCCGDYFKGGGFAYNILRFTETSVGSGGFWQISGDNSFNELTFGANAKILGSNTIGTLNMEPGYRYEFEAGQTQNINIIQASGEAGKMITIKSTNSSLSAAILLGQDLCADYIEVDQMNINSDGAGIDAGANGVDQGGNSGNIIFDGQCTFPDLVKPVIELIGNATIEVKFGAIYVDQGASALDNIDGDITASITNGGTVNTAIIGSYTLTYNVNDSASNAAIEVIRTVAVILDDTNPTLVLTGDETKSTDEANCFYTVQGTEFDPSTATDDSGSLASLTYSLQKPAPNPNLISENFNDLSWDTDNFELGTNTGSIVNGAYKSDTSSRGTLRTKAEFVPTVENPLYVSATLSFTSGSGLAFIGTRSTGEQPLGIFNSEPEGPILRIHNFNNGQTNITPGYDYQPRPGNAFYANPVRFQIMDDGATINVTMTNLVTDVSHSFTSNNTFTTGSNRVVFSGDNTVSWDDIEISIKAHELVQEYQSGTNTLENETLEPGEHTIVWTAKDPSGNEVSQTQIITIEDSIYPVVITQDITITLDSNNEAAILPSDINNNSIDNCGIATITLDKQNFIPADIGDNTVTLSITDIHGNTSTETAVVTVISGDIDNNGFHDADFVTKWRTTTANETIRFPLRDWNNITVDWGDGTTIAAPSEVTVGHAQFFQHTYVTAGDYAVTITTDSNLDIGWFEGGADRSDSKSKLIEVIQWGTGKWSSFNRAFSEHSNVIFVATDLPDLSICTDMTSLLAGASVNPNIGNWDVSNITNMSNMFSSAVNFNQDLSSWDVSKVTNMSTTFNRAYIFNANISSWDVSKVTTMEYMFTDARDFNQNIGSWNTSAAVNMRFMFKNTSDFNQDLNNWDVSNVTNMIGMFDNADAFNQDLMAWDVSSLISMQYMFANTEAFNGNISGWDVSKVTSLQYTFYGSKSFNQDLSAWDVSNVSDLGYTFSNTVAFNQPLLWDSKISNVTTMHQMFSKAKSFNQNISNWDVSKVTDMVFMFAVTDAFNQDLSTWDVSSVTSMRSMFQEAKAFNLPLNWSNKTSSLIDVSFMFYRNNVYNSLITWDASSITNMESMFEDAVFNQNIGDWNVSSVTNLRRTFRQATAFDQNLGNWNVSAVTTMQLMFDNTGLSETNYDALLNGWNTRTLQNGVLFNGGNSTYCAAAASRQNLINTFGWTITDNGECDSDDDGVNDALDLCDNTPTGETVDANGCSDSQKDSDEDGVNDAIDLCDNTPTGETVDANGCSDSQKDTDKDGVNDALDLCDNTPTGETVDSNGCSDSQKDSDEDGINDALDICDNTPTGETVDSNGCSDSQKDSDEDGVNDALDICDNTPTGETVDSNGCSDSQKDTDEDGINDALDICDNTPTGETVDSNGCSDSQKDMDTDGDGTLDSIDNCVTVFNADQTDTDQDGLGDACDDDDDNDGTPDVNDIFPLDADEDSDADNDGIGDNEDDDDDNDGTIDSYDVFPNNADEDTDTDGDGIGDQQDDDDDNDGTLDVDDAFPLDGQENKDADHDGIGDNTDDDNDNDGIINSEDAFPFDAKPTIIAAEAFTPNGDGINDSWVVPGIENYPNAIVSVYNRWGHTIFSTKNYQNDWSGSYKSNADKLPPGSYMYIITFQNGIAPVQGWLFINY